jgi:hypothetical protein
MFSIGFWIKVEVLCLLLTPLGVIAVAALLNRLQDRWAGARPSARLSKITRAPSTVLGRGGKLAARRFDGS